MQNSSNKEPFTFYKVDSYILNHLGVEPACVHAVIRNKSQTPGYVCEFSEQTIGNILHMSYKRVKRAIGVLLENGFIEPAKGKTNLRTNAYQCILEKCDIPLTKENSTSLVSNDNRVKKHKEDKLAYNLKKQNALDGTICINNPADTNPTIEEANDGTYAPTRPAVEVTNHPPIKNSFKEIDNKELGVVSSFYTKEEMKVKVFLEKELDYKFSEQEKWKTIFSFIYERDKNKQKIRDFVDYILDVGFDIRYMTIGRLQEIYLNDIQETKEGMAWYNLPDWKEGMTMQQYNEMIDKKQREEETQYVPMPDYMKPKWKLD